MREDFVRHFGGVQAGIRDYADYQWLVRLLDEENILLFRETEMHLRPDAFVFLFSNLRIMIVRPWEAVEGRDFYASGMSDLIRRDVRDIFRLAAEQRREGERKEISANAVFQAIAQLGEGLRTRAEEFWGP